MLRTSVPKKQLSAAKTVRSYKALCGVERAFRSLKTVDLKIRPIHHWLEPRVRAHIFLYMLAYYVEWHMREAWRELLFADEDLEAKRQRDPLAPAQRSEQALQKIPRRTLDNGIPVHSFQTLLQQLSTIVRNTCRTRDSKSASLTFQMLTTPIPRSAARSSSFKPSPCSHSPDSQQFTNSLSYQANSSCGRGDPD